MAGIGNLFFSDDGFGPEVVRRLAEQDRLPDDVRLVDYGIRGMHLAYDLLDGYATLILVDALPGTGVAGELSVLEVEQGDIPAEDFDPHGMNPVAVLASLETLGGVLPPTYVVGCRPGVIEEGIGLSPPVADAVPEAMAAVHHLVREGAVA